jgi:hypothetical protein
MRTLVELENQVLEFKKEVSKEEILTERDWLLERIK